MSLPILKQTVFTFDLPSTGQTIHFRPFTVAEEKILLTAQAADDLPSKISAIKQIINNCCVDPIDVDKLASFDIEYFFVQLRSKSVSNIVDVEIELVKDKKQQIRIDLNDVKVQNKAEKKLMIDDETGIGVTLGFPTFELIQKAQVDDDDPSASLNLFRDLIETVFTKDEVFDVKMHPVQELDDFLNSLSLNQLQKIQDWLINLPYIYIDVSYFDEEGQTQTTRLRGLDSFFG